MSQSFAQKLAIGGKTNSLGQAAEVVQEVLADKQRLNELYDCLFEEDAWLRMRAADSLEKVCRVHPEWLLPYTNRLLTEVAQSTQPSLQWHLAQMLAEITLSPAEQKQALHWLTHRLQDPQVDWIVAANTMKTLVQFSKQGLLPASKAAALIALQQNHTSASVRKRVATCLAELASGQKTKEK